MRREEWGRALRTTSSLLLLVADILLAVILIATLSGCDEGMTMADTVMNGGPGEMPGAPDGEGNTPKPTTNPTTNGEIKEDPEPTVPATPETEEPDPETPEPAEEEPAEPEVVPEVVEPKPEPPTQQTTGKPVLPGATPLSEARAREKAYKLVKKELFPIFEERAYGKETSWNPFVQKAREFLDIDVLQTMATIRDIHIQERPEDQEVLSSGKATLMQLIAEYLRLTYQYPEESQDEILVRFRQVARDGKTILRWFEVELALGVIDPLYIEAKDIAWTIFDRWAELLRQRRSGTLSDAEYDKALDKMYAEVTGLPYFNAWFLRSLEDTYATVYPDMDDFVSRESTVGEIIPLIWEFMYVALQNPDASEHQARQHFEAYVRETPTYAIGKEGYPVHAISLDERNRYRYREATFKK